MFWDYKKANYFFYLLVVLSSVILIIGGIFLLLNQDKSSDTLVAAKVIGLKEGECPEADSLIQRNCLTPVIEYLSKDGKQKITELNTFADGLGLSTKYTPGEAILINVSSNEKYIGVFDGQNENSGLNYLAIIFISLGFVILASTLVFLRRYPVNLPDNIHPKYNGSNEVEEAKNRNNRGEKKESKKKPRNIKIAQEKKRKISKKETRTKKNGKL